MDGVHTYGKSEQQLSFSFSLSSSSSSLTSQIQAMHSLCYLFSMFKFLAALQIGGNHDDSFPQPCRDTALHVPYTAQQKQQQVTGTRTYSKLLKQIENIYRTKHRINVMCFSPLFCSQVCFSIVWSYSFVVLHAPLDNCSRRQAQVNQMRVRIFHSMCLKIYMLLVTEGGKTSDRNVLKSHLYS